MKGIHDRGRGRELLGGGGLEPSEPVHGDDVDSIAPGLGPVGEPLLERLLGAPVDHVQQPCRPGPVADRGEVDDHGDELVAAAGMAPHVLVDPDDLHTVEAVRIVDEDPSAFGQDGGVGGVPRHPETFGDPGHGQVLAHDAGQRPPQPAARQLRPRLGRLAHVLAPHMPTASAPVAAHRHHQRRRTPPQRLVRQPASHRVPGDTLTPAAPAPLVRLNDPARQHRTIRLQALPDNLQAELVEAGERAQVRAGEGSVNHVEVFLVGSVRTSILGGPRPLPSHRRADHAYTVICEEPRKGRAVMSKLIESLSADVPTALTEIITLGRTLKKRAVDVLAYFDRPGTSNGPTEAINGRLEHLRGSALGFRNLTHYIARSLLETGGFRPRLHPES